MTISDETLLAYIDDRLDADARAAIDETLAGDPALSRDVAERRALILALRAAFDPVLDEPVPERLIRAARGTPETRVASPAPVFAEATAPTKALPAAGAAGPSSRPERRPRRRQSWRAGAALAASLIIGIVVGRATEKIPALREAALDHGIVAGSDLSRALTRQLASTQAADAPIKIGLSFRSRSGQYCRTFDITAERAAGLACKGDEAWQVKVLTTATAPPGGAAGAYRQAASEIPAAVMAQVNARIIDAPLDADAERAAQRSAWRP